MGKFTYFYYDNFDPADVRRPEDDPRRVLDDRASDILTEIVESPPGACQYASLCERCSGEYLDNLIHIGLLRREGDAVLLDSPVFAEEDAARLESCFSESLDRMTEALLNKRAEFVRLAEMVDNGFPSEVNLYHLLCGSVFDGWFFDYLSSRGAVTTSRMHPSGLDYLIIVYEQSPALDRFSRNLLCSYNRFSDGNRALQSFGDADGDRVDFFRFQRQMQQGRGPEEIRPLWIAAGPGDLRGKVLDELEKLMVTGSCDENCRRLLEAFGYVQDGKPCVPVYRRKHEHITRQLEQLTEDAIGKEMQAALGDSRNTEVLTSRRHGVAAGEIANELYHVVFGQLNERLVQAGLVAQPPRHPGQGRYLKSIQLF